MVPLVLGITSNPTGSPPDSVSSLRVPLTLSSYEKPTMLGWSMKSRFASLLKDQGFNVVLFESALTQQGPRSFTAEEIELKPGPPPMKMTSGALTASFLDSKNQKNELTVVVEWIEGGVVI